MSDTLAGIRARHADDEAMVSALKRGPAPDAVLAEYQWIALMLKIITAHADRGALLAAYDSACAEVVDVVNANVRLNTALDVTPEEVAQAIAETPTPDPSGVGAIWHGVPWAEVSVPTRARFLAMADAVFALLHERMEAEPHG